MATSKNNFILALFCVGALCAGQLYAKITPNPIISRGTGVTVKASAGAVTGINDNKWGPYEKARWTVTDNSWIAIKVVAGTYSKVFITWSNPDTTWSDNIAVSGDSCKKNLKVPEDYSILTSANSTTGADGDWVAVDSVKGNVVGARGHLVAFAGASWIKMSIAKGGGSIDEVEVFDATNGLQDSWFFLGTKFTAFMLKDSLASGFHAGLASMSDSNFANMVHYYDPTFTPAVIRGGIQCGILSTDVVRDISKYLSVAGNVHFWAIEVGLYDAWGGKNDNVPLFEKNLQIIVDSCKAHSIQPIIARIPGTKAGHATPAMWQVHADFIKAIDSVTKKNKLVAGADLYNYFISGSNNMGYYDLDKTGALPNAYGDMEAQKVWTLKMDTVVYKATTSVNPSRSFVSGIENLNVLSHQGSRTIATGCAGEISMYSVKGELLNRFAIKKAGAYSIDKKATGLYLVKFTSEKGIVETIPVLNR
jgi:hypothetical protein